MNNAVIQFHNVSKRYVKQRLRYGMLSETISSILGKAIDSKKKQDKNIIKALDNSTFDVKKGQAVGIIGPNGAGKSTILKLISRVTIPDSGRVVVHGKIGALIELGAGLHPELTGRENIYLYGAILGMKRNEVEQKFSDIISFAEIDDFLDMPIKRYSSGMYARLGFAVAVNMDPDILLIDEVLAVGDEKFQRKCFLKMNQIKSKKSTIVLVSHNMDWIGKICNRAIVLNRGKIIFQGNSVLAIRQYGHMLEF